MKKLNITFCSFPDYAGNAKALYEYMKKRYKDNMNYTWILGDNTLADTIEKDGAKAYVMGSKECEKYIPKTNIFFTTHANLADEKKRAPNSIYIELWHGIGPKPVGYLTKNISDDDKAWYDMLQDVIDYIIVPSEFWQVIFSTIFKVNTDRIKVLGLPLLDEIVYSNGKKNLDKVLGINTSQYNGIIMYMPTFKKGCGRELSVSYNENTIFNFKNYKDSNLIKYLQEKNYLLLVKRHPSDEAKYNIIENDNVKNITNSMLNKYSFNVNNILNAADLLITDYSSIGTEFTILDKPVIHISSDLNEYINERGIIFDDYNFWTNGNDCSSYEQMILLIDKLIKKTDVVNNKNLMFGDLDDGGCKRICNYLFDMNNLSEEVKLEMKLKKQKEKKEKARINEIKENEQRLKEIENSKSWRLIEKIRGIKRLFHR